jgi:hypothetical protein
LREKIREGFGEVVWRGEVPEIRVAVSGCAQGENDIILVRLNPTEANERSSSQHAMKELL